ncbi:DEAD/DEAH box helicase [Roseinatronobacter sp. S2]|uniref:DEAD/DEAH box helicase n=1 Tax=Roseinatronobacter sp. S2 TaxID=3035471 RepID=UPI00240F6D35|nr:DEAD/DEAH box helicase family protein [Roseinatronobacter sp. S2]WFE75250.1 DEAD/DEAH box helicase family protein [Roseinatronobacter sp. S2]
MIAKSKAVQGLLPSSVIELMERMSPGFLDTPEVNRVAAAILDPAELLLDNATRLKIIRLLPLAKARELCTTLGLTIERSPYEAIETEIAEIGLVQLFDFFGIVDDPRAPKFAPPSSQNVPVAYGLFPHQRVAARKVAAALAKPPRKVVLHMPTGAGKTRTAMHLAARHLREYGPTVIIWLAQNRELLDQAAEEFEKAWTSLGDRDVQLMRFWGSKRAPLADLDDGLLVAGLAKMAALDAKDANSILTLADRASLIVIDEAHQAIAPTYARVLRALNSKRPNNALLGLTATPGRTWSEIDEDKRLSDFFEGQKVVLEIDGYDDPVTFLMDQEYLARPSFRQLKAPTEICLSKADIRSLENDPDFTNDLLEKVGLDAARNEVILSEIFDALMRHDRIIVFTPSVENARLLQAMLTIKNVEALFVAGETDGGERERRIKR